jgi:hypothetical protein
VLLPVCLLYILIYVIHMSSWVDFLVNLSRC